MIAAIAIVALWLGLCLLLIAPVVGIAILVAGFVLAGIHINRISGDSV